MLTVVQVAYPLAPVGPDAAGGAEQILTALDAGLVARGHRSIVIACAGSRCQGTLVESGPLPAQLDAAALAAAQASHRAALAAVLARGRVDVVHFHGIDFHRCRVPAGPPSLVTLHLPLDWYPPEALAPRLHRVCVSRAQAQARPGVPDAIIDNGVTLSHFRPRQRPPRRFALALGRICPEKGLHLAAEAAARARVPLVIGGRLFAYPAHVDYYERVLRPRLGAGARWAGPLDLVRKRRLLAAARCLVVPSLAAETSSLVAMEALAAGTPVVALRAGALPDLVEHGHTGFIVDSVAELADALRAVDGLDRRACRAAAEERFSADRMIDRYLACYQALGSRRRVRA